MREWIEVCAVDELENEDVIRFDNREATFAIYRNAEGQFYATDGYCTHEKIHLSKGLVMGNIIECPKHNGRFDITTGAAKRVPVCVNLITYPTKVEAGKVYMQLG
ncbi:Rieske family ferredoxin [Paenibacillus pectinilyticus]|uniref:Rieske family ferredoxin n=1 Tax=Paenibacillus pectinilyticus TaxID=512399 RepID=A0A1C1A1U7_9BACL|nr:MocE family 2Fe-2S type ferredoxin [Paenibacillus pectinilyticus]OCT14488.1 Rieske family ferredoxin [Paenibacillus pectinilyticus]